MLNILAKSFMIATRTERPWLKDATRRDSEARAQAARMRREQDDYFLQGRRWQTRDPRDY